MELSRFEKFYIERKKNNVLITSLQAFGIILVVLGHALQIDSAFSNRLLLEGIIYSFHMPLFVFISGYLLKYTSVSFSSINIRQFIEKRIQRLLIPYIIISSIVFIPKALLSQYAVRPVKLSFASYFHMLLYPDDNVIRFFWFLPTLFIIMIVFLVVVKVGYLKSNIASNIIALSLLYVISALIGGHNVGFLAIYRVGFHFFTLLLE